MARPGLKGNPIINAFWHRPAPTTRTTQPQRPVRPVSLGVLPAMPFEIVGK
ncbi:MAG TPA: hypothetical protein VNA25_12090 [Phycisphaerae bacterium]|nr:hypothetical protein [Phycisphaerae bacterium]